MGAAAADLFAPGLACAGLHPARLVFADAGGKDVLAAMEEGLSHPGLAAVVGEFSGKLSLVASRRLQLAAEQSGVMAALLRRSRIFNDPALAAPSAAVTRWRIAALPSAPPLAACALGSRSGTRAVAVGTDACRGGEPGSWIVEACDATGRLTLVAGVAHGSAAQTGRAPPDAALVTAAHDGRRRVIAAVDAIAAQAGLYPGMPVAQAQALVPDLTVLEARPEDDAAALRRLAGWCLRYAPLAAAAPGPESPGEPAVGYGSMSPAARICKAGRRGCCAIWSAGCWRKASRRARRWRIRRGRRMRWPGLAGRR